MLGRGKVGHVVHRMELFFTPFIDDNTGGSPEGVLAELENLPKKIQ